MRDTSDERLEPTGECWAELWRELVMLPGLVSVVLLVLSLVLSLVLPLGLVVRVSAAERSAWMRFSRKCFVFCLLAIMERASTPGENTTGRSYGGDYENKDCRTMCIPTVNLF